MPWYRKKPINETGQSVFIDNRVIFDNDILRVRYEEKHPEAMKVWKGPTITLGRTKDTREQEQHEYREM